VALDPLIVDIYPRDFGGKPNLEALIAAGPPWHGLIMKASEGTYYPSRKSDADWFADVWKRTRTLAGARLGAAPQPNTSGLEPFYRGAYHYLRIDQDPVAQADRFMKRVEIAGGWARGDLWPMVDVEGSENPEKPGSAKIVDVVSKYAAHIRAKLGRSTMLYGNIYLAENGVHATMGCGALMIARYTADLPAEIYERIGWKITKPPAMPTVWGWQYSGAPEGGHLHGYPTVCPLGAGNADIFAMIVAGGGALALSWTSSSLDK
jgi:hypothetical protein